MIDFRAEYCSASDYKSERKIALPRIGNGFVWTVSVVEGTILFEAVGDIALALELVYTFSV